jgi:hypothetical protein
MLRRATIAVVATIAILIVLDWATTSFVPRPCLIEKVIQTKGQQKPEERHSEHTCAYRGGIVTEGVAYAHRWSPDAWTAIFTLVIAVFTTVLGVFTVSLAHSTRVTAEAAEKSANAAIANDRPYVYVEKMSWDFTGRDRSDAIKLTFSIKNAGRGPALMRSDCTELWLGKLPKTPPLDLVGNPNRYVLGAGDAFDDVPIYTLQRDRTKVDQAREGGIPIYLVGFFEYGDMFGNERKTGFCYRFHPLNYLMTREGGDAWNYDRVEPQQ